MTRALCQLDEVPDQGAKGFPGPAGSYIGLVVIRRGDSVYVYENACPHIGTPLDWVPDRFMSRDGKYLLCATHGAVFVPDTGLCLLGPCKGDSLTRVDAEVRDGTVYVPA